MSIGASMQPQRMVSEEDVLQEFLDRAIHDLRASVRQVGISTELLCETLHKELDQNEPSLRRLRDGVAGMSSILTGMSSYSVALSASNYTFRPVNLKTALSSALARLRDSIALTGAAITQDGLPEVTGDADRLSEVFQHLIGNALKYKSEAKPQIDVTAKREGDLWLIAVRDNGIGFEPKYWEHVFTPFYRLHGPEIPGIGLGLAVCRRILKTHQGRIWIESEKGRGTKCFFSLPAENDN